ncbi:MAG: hypothetical protein H6509_08170 [Bryobacterales bacterium]|nr:hypothetical protein [Acidobacteriota bacterium]MCB9384576.1 hypothetical protein [Bryobacterales bacterium]
MIRIEERNDLTPLCPHCSQPAETLLCRRVESLLGKRYVYFCSACMKVLGVSQRKGFWMG